MVSFGERLKILSPFFLDGQGSVASSISSKESEGLDLHPIEESAQNDFGGLHRKFSATAATPAIFARTSRIGYQGVRIHPERVSGLEDFHRCVSAIAVGYDDGVVPILGFTRSPTSPF